MRAARITELGRAPEPCEAPEPSADGKALFELAAVALNPLDINVGAGRFYGGHPPLPYVPGCEGVGRAPDGTRVYLFGDGMGTKRDGLLAERVAAPEELAIPVPEDVDDATAAACGIAGLAGWLPVSWRAPVREGDRVLVLGATGTVGLVALQGAKLLGAARVVAAGRDEARLERARELGADATAKLDEGDLAEAFRAAFDGDGPTLIVDPLWGAPAQAAAQAAAHGFRLVQIGQSAGPEATFTSAVVRGKDANILGYSDFTVPREVFRNGYVQLAGHVAAGRIRFDVETFPLDQVDEAWRRQQQGAKAVVTL